MSPIDCPCQCPNSFEERSWHGNHQKALLLPKEAGLFDAITMKDLSRTETYLGTQRLLLIISTLVLITCSPLIISCSESTSSSERVTEVPTSVSIPPRSLSSSNNLPYSILDGNGKQVVFNESPERIIALDSAVVEILFAIGEGLRVVGTHKFVKYPQETASIPKVSDASNIDIEATVELEPDLVVVFAEGFVSGLEKAGLNVLYLNTLTDDFTQVADNIRMWGRITGNNEGAEKVASEFTFRIQIIERKMANQLSGPSVFQDHGSLWTPGNDTLMGRVFSLLKLKNIAYDISGYAQMSPEAIVERNPDIVIASFSKAITSNPSLSTVSAITNNRVLVLSSDSLNIAGPRFIDGIEEIAKWVYPDLFK